MATRRIANPFNAGSSPVAYSSNTLKAQQLNPLIGQCFSRAN